MASVFAELERCLIRERTKAALAAKKARGECVGEVPYGWSRVGLDPSSPKLEPNMIEQNIVKHIVSLNNTGMDCKQIAASLNAQGVRAKKGGCWGTTQVRRILERNK
jgi:DNA invertase Pin-like site-specific DNA recombinase